MDITDIITHETTTIEEENALVIGPFKANNYHNEYLYELKVEALDSNQKTFTPLLGAERDYFIATLDSYGKLSGSGNLAPGSKKVFYIVFRNTYTDGSGTKCGEAKLDIACYLRITYTHIIEMGGTTQTVYYTVTSPTSQDGIIVTNQDVGGEDERYFISRTITWDNPKLIELNVVKTDPDGAPIKDAQLIFNKSKSENYDRLSYFMPAGYGNNWQVETNLEDSNTVVSNSLGFFPGLKIIPNTKDADVTLSFTEVAPEPYNSLGEIIIHITVRDWKVEDVKFSPSSTFIVSSNGEKEVNVRLINSKEKPLAITINKDFSKEDENQEKIDELNGINESNRDNSPVKFKITFDGLTALVNGKNFTSGSEVGLDSSRVINISNIVLTGTTGTIKVEETKTVDGYELAEEVTYTIKKDSESYTITSAGDSEGTWDKENNTFISTIENNPNNYIVIVKKDLGGKPLKNISFNITIYGVKECTIDGKKYNDENSDGIIGLTTKTDASGQILIKINSYHLIGDVDFDNDIDDDDKTLINNLVGSNGPMPANSIIYDINGDGLITDKDANEAFTTAKNVLKGDLYYIGIKLVENETKGYETLPESLIEYYDYKGKIIKAALNSIREDIQKVLNGTLLPANLDDLSARNNHTVRNIPQPYPLILQKVDSAGNIVKGEYEFDIEIDNVNVASRADRKYGIHINPKYLSPGNYATTDEKDNVILAALNLHVKTDENGEVRIDEIYATSLESEILVKETKSGNKIFMGEATATINKSVNSDGSVKITVTKDAQVVSEEDEDVVNIYNKEGLTIQLNKESTIGEKLQGAEFTIELKDSDNNVIYTDNNKRTDPNGQISINCKKDPKFNMTEYLNAINNGKTFELTFTETKAPDGYELPSNPVSIVEFKYVNNAGDAKYELINPDDIDAEFKNGKQLVVKITNSKNLPKLTLIKRDSVDPTILLPGATFNIEFTNVNKLQVRNDCLETSLAGYGSQEFVEITDISNTVFKTNSDGKILLQEIQLTDKKSTITLTEKEAPNSNSTEYYYSKVNKPVTFEIEHKQYNGIEVTGPFVDGDLEGKLQQGGGNVIKPVSQLVSGNINSSDSDELQVTFDNTPLIDIAGQVWLDKQKGSKNAVPPNGIYDNDNGELGVEGVDVYLKRELESGRVDIDNTSTNSNGAYSFTGLERPDPNSSTDGYYVEFEYDGINYKDTKYYKNNNGAIITDQDANKPLESKAREQQKDNNGNITGNGDSSAQTRQDFNDKFKTIEYNTAYNTAHSDSDKIPLAYDYDSGNHESALHDMDDHVNGVNPANNGAKDFAIKSYTEKYTKTDKSVNFGMVKKEFDLNISNGISDVTYKINGKTMLVNANQTADAPTEVIYDIEIFKSDYNYRFDDYTSATSEYGEQFDNVDNGTGDPRSDVSKDNNLEIEVTYKLSVGKQTGPEAESAKVLYTYDTNQYTLISVGGQEQTDTTGTIEITFNKNQINTNSTVDIVFSVKKDDGYIQTEDICTNAEIVEYTTVDGGYIDKDSQPGNCKDGQHEDDCQSTKVTFKVVNDEREISGTVAEADENGCVTGKPIDDVIVQLIEIVHGKDAQDNSKDFEYIWQETVSGHNIVKARDEYGNVCEYKNDVQRNSGQYKFHGFTETIADSYTEGEATYKYGGTFIPGDYIVRFIYGDGRDRIYKVVWDMSKTPPERNLENITDENDVKIEMYDANNIYKYNGQDYKSAIDPKYHEEWYNENNYGENASTASKARDNEARRLKVMAYSVNVDKTTWNNLQDYSIDGLDNSWMCAETSKINVDKIIGTTEEKTVHFGLVTRPQTTLLLEKHITALSIKPNNTGANEVVNAKIENIEDLINSNEGDKIETTGTNNHLQAMKAQWWYVQEDIEELMQGAILEVEYTYVVKNQSDKDYISYILANAYLGYQTDNDLITMTSTKLAKPYAEYLRDLANIDTKGKTNSYGTYLGQFYYTGTNGAYDTIVKTKVDKIYDYINNKLEFVEAENKDFEIANKNNSGDIEPLTIPNGAIVANTSGQTGEVALVPYGRKEITVNRIIKNIDPFEYIRPKYDSEQWYYDENNKEGNADYTKKVKLRGTLSSSSSEIEINPYIAEIVTYSNSAGRVDMEACPGNASDKVVEVPSNLPPEKDNSGNILVLTNNGIDYQIDTKGFYKVYEHDECLASGGSERIIISKPTGGDKNTGLQITIVAIASVAVVGVGIFLIKKHVLTK